MSVRTLHKAGKQSNKAPHPKTLYHQEPSLNENFFKLVPCHPSKRRKNSSQKAFFPTITQPPELTYLLNFLELVWRLQQIQGNFLPFSLHLDPKIDRCMTETRSVVSRVVFLFCFGFFWRAKEGNLPLHKYGMCKYPHQDQWQLLQGLFWLAEY